MWSSLEQSTAACWHEIFCTRGQLIKAFPKLQRGEQVRTVRAAKTRARIPAGLGFVTLNLVHAIIAFGYVAQGTCRGSEGI